MATTKLTPLLRYFFIYDENYIYCKKTETKEERLILHLSERDSILKTGKFIEETKLGDSPVLEGWQSADLAWEDKHYGQWQKVYIQTFESFRISFKVPFLENFYLTVKKSEHFWSYLSLLKQSKNRGSDLKKG